MADARSMSLVGRPGWTRKTRSAVGHFIFARAAVPDLTHVNSTNLLWRVLVGDALAEHRLLGQQMAQPWLLLSLGASPFLVWLDTFS